MGGALRAGRPVQKTEAAGLPLEVPWLRDGPAPGDKNRSGGGQLGDKSFGVHWDSGTAGL